MHVEHELLPDDGTAALIEVRREGDPAPAWRAIRQVPMIRWGGEQPLTWLDSNSCSTTGAPVLVEGATYCVRVTAFDVAGNAAGEGAEVCAASETCELSDEPNHEVTPRSRCAPLPVQRDAMPVGVSDGGASGESPAPGGGGGGCAVASRGRPRASGALVLLGGALGVALAMRSRAHRG